MKKFLFLTLLLSAIGLQGWADKYPNVLYAVGSATSTNWDISAASKLYKYADSNKYQGFVSFTASDGELKFLCQTDWGDMWGANTDCDGVSTEKPNTIVYENGSTDNKFKPTFDTGLYLVTIDATTVGRETVTFKKWNNSTDVYEIGNAAQLSAFANAINNFETSINAKLTADVDWGTTNIMIGGNASDDSDYAQAYKGTFDGQGHTLTYSLSRTENYASLFKNLDGATIQNLRVAGSIKHAGKKKYTASIFGKANNGSVVKNCVSTVTLTNYTDEDATMGGIGALMYDSGSKIENCAFLGTMTGDPDSDKPYGVGGILGWAGNANVVVENCYVNGTIDVADNNTNIVIVRSDDITPTNCYYLNNGNLNGQTGATLIDASLMSSGELCYLLNERVNGGTSWYQKIDTDAQPIPFAKDGATVYVSGTLYCDGMTKSVTYENEEVAPTKEDHSYTTDGLCNNSHDDIICNDPQDGYVTLTDGYYQIGNTKDLKWFAFWVDKKNANVNAKLTDNIDFDGVTDFPGIGTSSNCYRGIFDGQKHIISNLKMNIEDNAVGFFRFITSGGTVIKRFTIDSSCSFSGNNGVGAFVGRAVGRNGDRDILFEELGNEADVTASGSNGSGILGVNQGSDAYITMKNCYNTGAISSDQEGGALSGWLGDKTKVINCYNMGAITNGEGLARAYSDKVASLNLFSTVDTSTLQITGTQKTSTDFQNGTVFAALFGYTNADPAVDGSVWRMDYDADTPHPVLYGNSIAMREDCQNTLPSKEMTGMSVTLYRTLTSGTWNSICLPFDLDADGIEKVFGEGTKVAEFASVNGVNNDNLHFGQVTSISARTPYLIYPANNRDIDTPIVLSGITIQPSPATVTKGGFNFIGIYSPTSITGKYFIASGNKIKQSTGGNLKGFRAYIESVAEARPLTFDFFDDVTTGVKDAKHLMNSGLLTTDNVYDLQGRRIANPTKGLYVVNGKKVVIK